MLERSYNPYVKKNNDWFYENLKRIGINVLQCDIDLRYHKITPQRLAYSKLLTYKTVLDRIDEDKNPEWANIVRQLVEEFDLLYEYKTRILVFRQMMATETDTFYESCKQTVKLYEEEIANLSKSVTNKDDNKQGSEKWFYEKIIASGIDFSELDKKENFESIDVKACGKLISSFRIMINSLLKGNIKEAQLYKDYIQNFSLEEYCKVSREEKTAVQGEQGEER